jgi:hypothetical protein
MVRLFIIFSEEDVSIFNDVYQIGDIIISDFNIDSIPDATFINVRLIYLNDNKVIARIRALFKELNKKSPGIDSYINNFYDCSFSVFAQYIMAIDSVRIKYNISQIIFVNKLNRHVKTFNYFLSEYESQGIYLYKRENIFLYYIIEYLIKNNLKYEFLNKKSFSYQWFYNRLRILAVLITRFYKDISISSPFGVDQSISEKTFYPDYIYIIRTKVQFEAIKGIISNNQYKHLILIGPTFIDEFNVKAYFNHQENINVVKFPKVDFNQVMRIYYKSLKDIIRFKDIVLEYKGLTLNYTQAFKEIAVMLPSLNLYRTQLSFVLKKTKIISKGIFITTELKSPHAVIDCKIARHYNLKPIQIMCVDQENRLLPNPISGDKYIVDFKIREKILKNIWDSNKVMYIQNVNMLNKKPTNNIDKKYQICFFSSFSDHDGNLNIINTLGSYATMKNINCCIKFHPRDKRKYQNQYKSNIFYIDKQLSETDLFNSFEVAVSFSSAVIYSIILKNIPMIYVKSAFMNDTNFISEYKPTVETRENIYYWLDNPRRLKNEFQELRIKLLYKDDFMSSTKYLNKLGSLISAA